VNKGEQSRANADKKDSDQKKEEKELQQLT